ncbi:MAG: hypothetical protein ACRDRL_14330 [Sciscionella sp.]
MSARRVPTWPMYLLALPAAVSIWAGWVGLGQMTGFGVVQLLPGIWDGARLNTAITLPVGMEAYAAYALKACLTPGVPARAREFAKTSALVALILGALGQITYHLMAAAHMTAAPWPITTVVSCLPVGVLGLGAALAHLLAVEDDPAPATPQPVQQHAPQPVTQPAPSISAPYRTVTPPVNPSFRAVPNWTATVPVGRPADRPAERPSERADPTRTNPPIQPGPTTRTGAATRSTYAKRSGKPRTDAQLIEAIRELAARNGGTPPSRYRVKQALGVGSGRAARLLADVTGSATPASEPGHDSPATRKEGAR